MRDTSFSITKAIAITLVVLSHSLCPGWLSGFVYQFHVPVFFICAGYFFNMKYLNDERTYVVHRLRGLYVPFVKWSLFFLVVHNLLFPLGLLSDQYGNATGGVTHPYTWHQFCQRLWSIIFNMSGYDEFICGAFWFFRALLVSSIGFLVLFKLYGMVKSLRSEMQVAVAVAFTALALAAWKCGEGLTMTGVAQGGYRELMGVYFMAVGCFMRTLEAVSFFPSQKKAAPANALGAEPSGLTDEESQADAGNGKAADREGGAAAATKWLRMCVRLLRHPVVGVFLKIVVCMAILVPFARHLHPSMSHRATIGQMFALAVSGVVGYILLRQLSKWLNYTGGLLKRGLVYVGDNTLYVFAFHLLAFKLVSAVKIAYYGLSWQQMGCHTAIHDYAGQDWFWLAYTVVGVAVPLLWIATYRRLMARYTFSIPGFMTLLKMVLTGVVLLLRALAGGIVKGVKSFVQGVRDVIEASSPKDE